MLLSEGCQEQGKPVAGSLVPVPGTQPHAGTAAVWAARGGGGVPARGRAGGVQGLWPGGHCVFSEFTSGQRVLSAVCPPVELFPFCSSFPE